MDTYGDVVVGKTLCCFRDNAGAEIKLHVLHKLLLNQGKLASIPHLGKEEAHEDELGYASGHPFTLLGLKNMLVLLLLTFRLTLAHIY